MNSEAADSRPATTHRARTFIAFLPRDEMTVVSSSSPVAPVRKAVAATRCWRTDGFQPIAANRFRLPAHRPAGNDNLSCQRQKFARYNIDIKHYRSTTY